jgi:ribonuclease VapC
LILDSSAVIAVLFREKQYERLKEAMAATDILAIGAPTLFETGMVMISRMGEPGRGLIAQFLEQFGVTVIPFGDSHWQTASEAFTQYGKGRHPAALNLGDCMTYATAQVAEKPLLFIGNDFAQTDIEAA